MADKQTLLMQQVWLKAHEEGFLAFELTNPADAKRMRFTLYNAVRTARATRNAPERLLKAVEACIVRYEAPCTVIVERRENSSLFKSVAAQLGISPEGLEEVCLGVSPDIGESLERLTQLLEAPAEAPPEILPRNPYYNRKGELE